MCHLPAQPAKSCWPLAALVVRVLCQCPGLWTNLLTKLWLLQVVLPVLKDIESKHSKAALGSVSSSITSVTLEYVAAMCSTLIQVKNFDIEDWETVRHLSS